MSESSFGLTQQQYEQGIDERVMPDSIKVSLNYILRMLSPSHRRPPYAVEMFGKVSDIEEPLEECEWAYSVALETDRPTGVVHLPLNKDGFIVTPNTGNTRDMERSEGFIAIGYFLGRTSLSDSDLSAIVSQPVSVANV